MDAKINALSTHLIRPDNIEVAAGYYPDLSDPFSLTVENIRNTNAPLQEELPTIYTTERALFNSIIFATAGSLSSQGEIRDRYITLVRELHAQPEMLALINESSSNLALQVADFILQIEAFGIELDFTEQHSLSNFDLDTIFLALFHFSLQIAKIPVEGKYGSTFNQAVLDHLNSFRVDCKVFN